MVYQFKQKVSLSGLLLGVFLVGFSLTSSLISREKPLWRDEAFSVIVAQNKFETIYEIAKADFNPPLYYWGLSAWASVFTTDVSMRLLSLLMAGIAISLIFWLLKRLNSDQLHPMVLILALLGTPNILYFSAELRGYILVMLGLSLSMVCFYKWVRNSDYKMNWLWGFVSGLLIMLLSHNIAPFWVFSNVLVIIVWLLMIKDFKRLGQLGMALIVVGLIYLPWFLVLGSQSARQASNFWLSFDPVTSLKEFNGLFSFNEGILRYKFAYEGLNRIGQLFMLGFFLSIPKLLWHRKKLGIDQTLAGVFGISLLFSLLLIYVYSFLRSPILYSRYISVFSPVILLINLFVLSQQNKFVRRIMYFLLGLQALLGCVIGLDYVKGNGLVNYRQLQEIKAPVYTREGLDIQPCHIYADCYFVGEFDQKDNYNGSPYLPNIKKIDTVSQITNNEIGLLTRREMDDDLTALEDSGFLITNSKDLGDRVYLFTLER